MNGETISVTVATSREGVPFATLSAELWLDDGRDHAEVVYRRDGRTYELSGERALKFLAVVASDVSRLLAPEPAQQQRRQAGF